MGICNMDGFIYVYMFSHANVDCIRDGRDVKNQSISNGQYRLQCFYYRSRPYHHQRKYGGSRTCCVF